MSWNSKPPESGYTSGWGSDVPFMQKGSVASCRLQLPSKAYGTTLQVQALSNNRAQAYAAEA